MRTLIEIMKQIQWVQKLFTPKTSPTRMDPIEVAMDNRIKKSCAAKDVAFIPDKELSRILKGKENHVLIVAVQNILQRLELDWIDATGAQGISDSDRAFTCGGRAAITSASATLYDFTKEDTEKEEQTAHI